MQLRPAPIARRVRRALWQFAAAPTALTRPVFVVGCGRSGTTILGETLGAHREVAYLNEPRDIWRYDRRTDIWSRRAERRGGRLCLRAADVDPAIASKIARTFATELHLRGARRLVEKLPINAFRIAYLSTMFPDALFVHVIRNGQDVARSIGQLAERGQWFGRDGYKWRLLAQHAEANGLGPLAGLCASVDLRGLLEWRLSVRAAREELAKLPEERWLEIRYEDFVHRPAAACERLARFAGLPPDPNLLAFANAKVGRRLACADMARLTPEALRVGGDLLAELGYLRADRAPPDV
jgi:hypothetical protein